MAEIDKNLDSKRGYFQGIAILRAVAALLVVLQHSLYYAAVSAGENYETYLKVGFGDIGVMVFFVISGFVITLNRGESGGAFVMKRLLRIYPAFFAACGLSLLMHRLAGLEAHLDAWTLLLLPSFSFNDTLSIPYWTLIFEMAFYVAASVAVLARLSDRTICVSALLWILTAQVAGQYFAHDEMLSKAPGPWIIFSPYIQLFCFGVLLCMFRDRISHTDPLILLAVAIGAFAAPYVLPMAPAQRMLFFAASYSGLIAAALHMKHTPYIWRRLGDWSYGLYLLHLPILAIMARTGILSDWGFWPTWFVMAFASTLIGNVFGYLETQFHRAVSRAFRSSKRSAYSVQTG